MSEPLKTAALHILIAVADGDRHGYAIMQAVREHSGGAIPLRTGSFYRHLSKLIADGLIREAAGPAGDDPRRGTYYRLTARGRQTLDSERRRLVALLAAFPLPARKGHA